MKIDPSVYLLAKYQHSLQATTELTMLSGASNRRGSPLLRLLCSIATQLNTGVYIMMQQIQLSTIYLKSHILKTELFDIAYSECKQSA